MNLKKARLCPRAIWKWAQPGDPLAYMLKVSYGVQSDHHLRAAGNLAPDLNADSNGVQFIKEMEKCSTRQSYMLPRMRQVWPNDLKVNSRQIKSPIQIK